ncbi:hypothetical protein DFH08DRAFT_802188 [Mycena albidolilacea]|uniref:Uncharacterized protein n=1 Tax=Mycena albidolilacea TaxID=1033008 RepID=A0AAD7AGU7_9AGAR|nr:hypothetical protein DFH08DRAFT_802188 [Mycena albidolilacea]
MVWVLKDIGVDIPALGLIEEAPVDYHGADLLATALLGGLLSWFDKLNQGDQVIQPCYESFAQVLQLLRKYSAHYLSRSNPECDELITRMLSQGVDHSCWRNFDAGTLGSTPGIRKT